MAFIRNRLSRLSLRTQMALTFLIVLLPLLLLSLMFFQRQTMQVRNELRRAERDATSRLTDNLNAFLHGTADAASSLYYNSSLSTYLSWRYVNPGESAVQYYQTVMPLIKQYRSLHPEYLRITLHVRNETLLTNNDELSYLEPGTKEFAIYESLQASPSRTMWITETVMDSQDIKSNAVEAITYYTPLNYLVPELGMLAISIRADAFDALLMSEPVDKLAVIMSPEGTVLASNRPDAYPYGAAPPEGIGEMLIEPEGEPLWREEQGEILIAAAVRQNDQRFTVARLMPGALMEAEWRGVFLNGALLLLAAGSISVLGSLFFTRSILRRVRTLKVQMRRVQEGDFTAEVPVKGEDEIDQLGAHFNEMTARLDAVLREYALMERRTQEMELLRREAELYALQSQINPHFLYNTLDAILSGIEENPRAAAESVHNLARLFRSSTRRDREMVPLKEEMGLIRDYLALYKYRMGDRLTYAIKIEPEAEDVLIPSLLVQPLVENSMVHGIGPKKGPARICVSAKVEETVLILTVEDDGVGISDETLVELDAVSGESKGKDKKRHVGLRNIRERIALTYLDDTRASLTLNRRDGGGTVAVLRLPLLEMEG